MTDQGMKQVAYVMAPTAAMLADLESMKAANMEREHRGESLAYAEEDFSNLILKYGLYHNAIGEILYT